MKTSSSLLRLLQLSSPTLPVGSYAYSQGIESAVNAGLISDIDSAQQWLQGVLLTNLAYGDLALLKHFYQAWQIFDEPTKKELHEKKYDKQAPLRRLNELSAAIRETHELLQEDQHLAKALMRLAHSLEVSMPSLSDEVISYPCVFARVAQQWNIGLSEAMTAFAWSWMENQIAALVKLVPLGQTQGQWLMMTLAETIEHAVVLANHATEDEIGCSLPLLAIVSSQHETQYSRLFRS